MSAEFRLYSARILNQDAAIDIDIAELEGHHRGDTCSRECDQCEERAVPVLHVRLRRHRRQDMPDLIQCRPARGPVGLGNACRGPRRIEVLPIAITKPRLEAGLTGEPHEKRLQRVQGRVDRGVAQRRFGSHPGLFIEMLLEAPDLLDVESLEIGVFRIVLEAIDRLGKLVDCHVAKSPNFLEILDVPALGSLVFGAMRFHVPVHPCSGHHSGRGRESLLIVTEPLAM
jgi:hypothetical protein